MADNNSNPTPTAPATETEAQQTPTPPPPSADPDLSTVPAEVESLNTTDNNIDLPPPPTSQLSPASVSVSVSEAVSVVAESESEKEPAPATGESDVKAETSEDVVVIQDETSKPAAAEEHKIPQNLVSFKEESNRVSDLSHSERKALEELKQLLTDAFTSPKTKTTNQAQAERPTSESDTSTDIKRPQPTPTPTPTAKDEQEKKEEEEEVSIWGVPLLKDDRTDVILLKFLRARDFKVKDAFAMIHNTLRWRKDFNIDALVDEDLDLGDDLDKVVFMHGHAREGHPVCYNVYGEFQNKELYHKAFSNEERRTKFLRWRIQFLERSIRNLDFTPAAINTIFQVNDLHNSPGPAKRELRLATKHALQLLQDNYPEFVAKQVFINVPWWYLAFYTMISPFLTQRTKSKFVFAGPSKSPDTLFKYISPEQVPVQYGGLSVDFCDCNPDFSMSDPITEIPIKPTTKQTVEIAIYEKCIIVWELRVVGWEVSHGAEFKPDAKDGYTVIIHKATKMSPSDEPVVSNSFKVGELGKLLLTIDNPTLKKKRLLYRFKIKPYSD